MEPAWSRPALAVRAWTAASFGAARRGSGCWWLRASLSLSLEQPTVTEQTISTAAKISALVFLPQVTVPQVTDSVSAMVRIALMRVMLMRVIGLPPADERRLE